MARRYTGVGRFLSRNMGKVGGDGRIAVDKWCGLWVYQGQCGQEK